MDINSILDWIEKNKDEEPVRLRLRHLSKTDKPEWLDIAISTIESRKKALKKLSFNGDYSLMPDLIYPNVSLEQSSSYETAVFHRDVVFELMNGRCGEILDMTCGLGVDVHAFATIAEKVTAIEYDPVRYKVACLNFRNFDNIHLLNDDCRKYISKSDVRFDVVFIDPARRSENGGRVYGISDCQPDIIPLVPILKEKTSVVIIKLSPMLDIVSTLKELPNLSRLYVVGAKGECKELLAVMDFRMQNSDIDYRDIPLTVVETSEGKSVDFNLRDEEKYRTHMVCSMPNGSCYLYQPSASMMKTGCYASIAKKYDISPISMNSHLYMANHYNNTFLGKIYEIKEIADWSKATAKRMVEKYGAADVSVRNFPLSAMELSRRIGLPPNSKNHLFTTTDKNGRKIMIMTSSITGD